MRLKKVKLDPERQARLLASIRQSHTAREDTYREQALKLFPHVCARCGREFAGKQLAELTVHHKDSDHMNNPPDGSNWELLCLYCHDDAHQSYERSGYYNASAATGSQESSLAFRPFEGLKAPIEPEGDRSDSDTKV